MIASGEKVSWAVQAAMEREIAGEPLLRVDYIAIVRLSDLEEIRAIEPGNTLVAAAVHAGRTRLIDNYLSGDISC
jgi:pantothenate synthetase